MNTKQKALEIWKKAQIHRKSCEIGRPIPNQPFQLCECCDQIIFTEPMSICEHSKEFFMFGYGYPLWFSFLKHCMLLVFVLIISKTATEIYIATQENYQFCYGAKQVVEHPIKEGLIPALQGAEMNAAGGSNNGRVLLSPKSVKDQQFNRSQNFQHQTKLHLKSHQLFTSFTNSDQFQQPSSYQSYSSQQQSQSRINPTGQRQCTSFFVYLSYFKQQKLIKDWFLTVIEFLAHLVALIYFRNTIMKQEQKYNEKACLISDYTLLVQNLPKAQGLRQSIINLFVSRFRKSCNTVNADIQQVIFVFQDPQIKSLEEEKIKLQNELIDAEKQGNQQKMNEKALSLQNTKIRIDTRVRQVRQLIDRDEISCQKVLVTLRTQLDRVQILQQYKKDLHDGVSYNQYFNIPPPQSPKLQDQIFTEEIAITAAHQPNEIIWENIYVMEKTRKMRSLIGWLLTLVVLAIATLIFYFIIKGKSKLILKALQNEYEHSRMPTLLKVIALVIVLIALIGIVLFNKFVLQKVLRYIVSQEKHAYKDKQNLSFAVKYAFAIFFTTALMTLIIEAFMYQNYYTHHLGLIEEISLMFIVIALLIPLILWIGPFDIYKNWQREKVYGKLIRQQQANEMIEDYHYDMSKKYSEIFKLMWITFLYAELIPLGSFLTIIGIVFYYWVDKYNFVKSCTRKPGISGKMTLLAVKSIDMTLFLVPAGSFLFDLMLRHHFNVLSLVLMLLGIVYVLLPMSDLIWLLNDEKFQLQRKTYPEVVSKFRQTYLSMHPVYSKTHYKEIQSHRMRVKQYYRNEIRKQKIYEIRKGTYFRQQPGYRKMINISE